MLDMQKKQQKTFFLEKGKDTIPKSVQTFIYITRKSFCLQTDNDNNNNKVNDRLVA